jgi:hypothetical protein
VAINGCTSVKQHLQHLQAGSEEVHAKWASHISVQCMHVHNQQPLRLELLGEVETRQDCWGLEGATSCFIRHTDAADQITPPCWFLCPVTYTLVMMYMLCVTAMCSPCAVCWPAKP